MAGKQGAQQPRSGQVCVKLELLDQKIDWRGIVEDCLGSLEWGRILLALAAYALI